MSEGRTHNAFFKGKKVLVTGAGKGIGRALVVRLWQLGAKPVAVTRSQRDLDSLKEELGASLSTVCVDLADWQATRLQLKEAVQGVHCLVNNAAVAQLEPFLKVSEEHFDQSFGVNVKAVVNVSQMVAEDMIGRGQSGAIVNVSSQASQRALADHAVYCSTKAALDALSKVMALELGKHKIRVNCVNPTVVLTAMGRLGWSDPVKAGPMLARIPVGRFAEEQDVVEAVLFLLNDSAAAMVHGCSLPVDGGFLVT
ncbi:L-xylulose reductase-like [Neocloeon triangulifer]|uniref:L-xylulose reductase-like n=1 Tax=Neocloeon triangulifer TaxID=2078957 RepID=UPI00286F9805|nr:L-xylulose reductase-like [Neocloeon triangulifer]